MKKNEFTTVDLKALKTVTGGAAWANKTQNNWWSGGNTDTANTGTRWTGGGSGW